jgi:hypothetical protein
MTTSNLPRFLCKNRVKCRSFELLTITFLISDLKPSSVVQVISWVFVS